MATVEEQVRAATSLTAALLVLARSVDALRASTTLEWSSVGETAAPAAPQSTRERTNLGHAAPPVALRDISDQELLAFLATQFGAIPDLSDPDVQGRIQELRYELARAGPEGEPERAAVFIDESGVGDIDMGPQDEAHREARYAFARDVLQLELALGPHPDGRDWCADYAAAGPMFLYVPQRDLLLQYPESARRVMVEDLERYDERVAAEVGRDLLRREAADRSTAFPVADNYEPAN